MLRALPFRTIGDVARCGHELHAYCPRCYASRPVEIANPAVTDRSFATVRFRCTVRRPSGETCGCRGVPKIRPRELMPVGEPVTLTFLWCSRCLWEIDQAQLDQPPWSDQQKLSLSRLQRHRCLAHPRPGMAAVCPKRQRRGCLILLPCPEPTWQSLWRSLVRGAGLRGLSLPRT